MNPKIIPNVVTVFRILCIIPVVWGLLSQHYMTALVFFVIAGFSDALDGYLARNLAQATPFGAVNGLSAARFRGPPVYGFLGFRVGHRKYLCSTVENGC